MQLGTPPPPSYITKGSHPATALHPAYSIQSIDSNAPCTMRHPTPEMFVVCHNSNITLAHHTQKSTNPGIGLMRYTESRAQKAVTTRFSLPVPCTRYRPVPTRCRGQFQFDSGVSCWGPVKHKVGWSVPSGAHRNWLLSPWPPPLPLPPNMLVSAMASWMPLRMVGTTKP